MKIGIVVYSKTNNTMSVVQLAQQKFIENGHEVALMPLILNPDGHTLQSIPSINGYDYLIFATPVHAFQASLPMKQFLYNLPKLDGVQIGILITMSFKKPFLGGNRAIKQIKKRALAKGASLKYATIIHWSSPLRTNQIVSAVNELTL